jgi:hypothetical protein
MVSPRQSFEGVRSPPLPWGGQAEDREGLSGQNPGMTRKAVFSEGRTLCVRFAMAKRVPRDFNFHGMAVNDGRSPSGDMPRSSQMPFLCGRAEPAPPRGAKRRREGLTGANPGMALRAVFSEGRTLCVRLAWPNVCRDIAFPHGMAVHEAWSPKRGMLGLARGFPLRACGARPSRRGDRKRGGLAGEGPGMTRKAVFSEGRTLCVRVVRPRECQDIAFPPGAFTIAPQSKRGMLGLARCFPLRACGARPSRRGDRKLRWPRGGKARR